MKQSDSDIVPAVEAVSAGEQGPTADVAALLAESGNAASDVIPVLEETLSLSKRAAVTGKVRVSTRTETRDEIAEMVLDRTLVDVTRVPVGQVVEVAPDVRTEGDTTIVPVVEERVVLVKQLYLKEELHIRRHIERQVSRTSVALRRQVVTVDRIDAHSDIIEDPGAHEV